MANLLQTHTNLQVTLDDAEPVLPAHVEKSRRLLRLVQSAKLCPGMFVQSGGGGFLIASFELFTVHDPGEKGWVHGLWGDPGFDIGFAMTHLLSKAHHLSTRRAPLRDAADLFWKTYAASVGPPLWNPSSDSMAVRHTLGCLLARVAGRSTLEYLTQDQRARQREAVIQLMHTLPPTMAELIDSFTERVNAAN